MENNKTYSLSLQRTYITEPKTIYNLFEDNTIFKLTGANDIQADFKAGGLFRMTFDNRGTIYGQFVKININDIKIEWNVEGFQRPDEMKTSVEISLCKDKEKSILTLNHKNILFADSALAKQRAWTAILEKIELCLSNNR